MTRNTPDSVARSNTHGDAGPSQTVIRRLLELIHNQGLKVGDQLPTIRQLTSLLGVGPTAVRDALLQAQTMGLLRIQPRSGAYVQSLTYASLVDALSSTIEPALRQADHNLLHLLDTRRLLEIEMAGRVADRRQVEDLLPLRQALDAMARHPQTEHRGAFVDIDIRFHTEIARLAGNSVMLTLQQALLGLLKPHLTQLPWNPPRRQRVDQAHLEIYTALVEGDAPRARAAMAEHLNLANESLLREIQSLPDVPGAHSGSS